MPDSTVVGVDISKTHLDAYMAPGDKAARFTNDAAGFKALVAWIESPVRAVTYEPTGPWHRAFEEALLKAALPLVRVNPLQARRFAQAIGQRAKTDAVDARVLAQMGAALELRPTEASSPAGQALAELQVARDALVKDRTATQARRWLSADRCKPDRSGCSSLRSSCPSISADALQRLYGRSRPAPSQPTSGAGPCALTRISAAPCTASERPHPPFCTSAPARSSRPS